MDINRDDLDHEGLYDLKGGGDADDEVYGMWTEIPDPRGLDLGHEPVLVSSDVLIHGT